jgi:hypothetical protein
MNLATIAKQMKTKHFAIPYRWYLLVVTVALGAVVGRVHAQDTMTSAKKNPKPIPPALWVIDGSGDATHPSVSAFGGAQLIKKTGAIGSSGIRFPATSAGVIALTFDNQHNLWISFCAPNPTPGFLIELSAAGLKNPISNAGPKIIIDDPSSGVPEFLACPDALAFDTAGNLWVATFGGSAPELLEYAKADLSSSEAEVQPTPAVIIDAGL